MNNNKENNVGVKVNNIEDNIEEDIENRETLLEIRNFLNYTEVKKKKL